MKRKKKLWGAGILSASIISLATTAQAYAYDVVASTTAAFDTGLTQLVDVTLYCIGAAVAVVMGFAGFFAAVKWVIGKIQGRRK